MSRVVTFRPVALLAAGVAIAVALWAERGAISSFPWRLSWSLFIAAVVLFGIMPLFGATAFWLLVRGTTGRTAFGAAVHVWMRSFVSRYVPLGALTLAVRIRAQNRLLASRAEVLNTTAYEQVAAVVGGASVATLALVLSGQQPPTWVFLLLGGVVAATGAVFAAALRLKRFPLAFSLPARAFALASAVNCVGWIVAGAAAWILVDAVSPSTPELAFLTGAYALAWLTGFVVPFAPSGLGVREATLAGLLAPQFGLGPATTIAVALRFSNIVGDLLVVAAVEACVVVASQPLKRATLPIS